MRVAIGWYATFLLELKRLRLRLDKAESFLVVISAAPR